MCGGWHSVCGKFRLVSNDIYATDLLFSPRAPVRLSVCAKHGLCGQDSHDCGPDRIGICVKVCHCL